MIISDLNYLEVVSQAESIEGGLFNNEFNSAANYQQAGDSVNYANGLVAVNALNSSPVNALVQGTKVAVLGANL